MNKLNTRNQKKRIPCAHQEACEVRSDFFSRARVLLNYERKIKIPCLHQRACKVQTDLHMALDTAEFSAHQRRRHLLGCKYIFLANLWLTSLNMQISAKYDSAVKFVNVVNCAPRRSAAGQPRARRETLGPLGPF